MGIKLGDTSIVAGIVTGKGMIGKAARDGLLGFGSKAIADDAYSDEEEAKKKAAEAAGGEKPQGMKKGGAVKAKGSKRGDGICAKGKTKGRMV